MAYIYQIVNDINQKIYVGKTEFSIEKRFKEHCQDAFRERNEKRPLYAAMRKYGIENFHIELIEETNNPEEREIFWIENKRSFKNGYNATIGGDGKKYIDYDLVISTYKEIKNAVHVAEMLGIHPDSVYNILKHNNISSLYSSENSPNKELQGKICGMFSINGELLKSFSTIKDAARYINQANISKDNIKGISSHISQVCNGKRKSAYGYIWKYEDK